MMMIALACVSANTAVANTFECLDACCAVLCCAVLCCAVLLPVVCLCRSLRVVAWCCVLDIDACAVCVLR